VALSQEACVLRPPTESADRSPERAFLPGYAAQAERSR
jgi:hypothetical protein